MMASCCLYNHIGKSQEALSNDAFWNDPVPKRLIPVVMYEYRDKTTLTVVISPHQVLITARLSLSCMLQPAELHIPLGPSSEAPLPPILSLLALLLTSFGLLQLFPF